MASPKFAEIEVGSVVGSYRILGELGRGGCGVVYEAVHAMLPRVVALKVMHGELSRQPGMATRMVLEATVLDNIRHPGITRVYESAVLADGRLWIAMELVDGVTLARRMAQAIPVHDVAKLIGDVAEVLGAAHTHGIVHRDLKPDNLLLVDDPDFSLRVIDWGIARRARAARITVDGVTAGTPSYMSPEQVRGETVGPESDIYSLGVVAYETLTGSRPFEGCTVAEVVCGHLLHKPGPMTGVPIELARLVLAMLAKDPADRPKTRTVRETARKLAIEYRALSDARSTLDMQPVVNTQRMRCERTEIAPLPKLRRWTPEIAPVADLDLHDCNPEPEKAVS